MIIEIDGRYNDMLVFSTVSLNTNGLHTFNSPERQQKQQIFETTHFETTHFFVSNIKKCVAMKKARIYFLPRYIPIKFYYYTFKIYLYQVLLLYLMSFGF